MTLSGICLGRCVFIKLSDKSLIVVGSHKNSVQFSFGHYKGHISPMKKIFELKVVLIHEFKLNSMNFKIEN